MFFDMWRERVSLTLIGAVMADGGYYRNEAQRCRDLAVTATDSKTARRWHKIADQYAILAEELDAHLSGRPPLLQQQPQQQQQQKINQRGAR